MVLRKNLEQFDLGHKGPAIRSCPTEFRVFSHTFDPTVHINAFLTIEHSLGKGENLLARLIVIFSVARQLSHLGYSRNTHEEVVKPKRVRLRTISRERAISQSILLRHYVVKPDINNGLQIRFAAGAFRFYHSGRHGTRIVEGTRSK